MYIYQSAVEHSAGKFTQILLDNKISIKKLIIDFFCHLFRPINGQMEIIGVSNSYKSTEWKAAEGIFVHPSSEPAKKYEHTEL